VRESLLRFDGDKPYGEVEIAPGKLERRELELGVSDGIHAEVKKGLEDGDKIKEPEAKKKED
jgi:HlyD family secretion protein